jgi:eukaryotic-like serine/threonine-protein kinase
MSLQAGTRLGAFEIVDTIGAGGMGQVYRARDTRLNRTVAIKVLPDYLATDPLARARFVREGQTLAALSHPNLVSLYDVGAESGVSFAVMELVNGETLQAKLAAGRLSMRRVTDYAAQIARGLSAAHDKGVVHRDLKPANIIVAGDGHVKVLDFGLAKSDGEQGAARRSEADTALATDPGMVMGTVGYMSPEQVRGLASDARSDIFSFGAVLYEMATRSRAFDRESAAETMTAILKDDAPQISPDLGVPPALERIIRRCLEKRPEDRFRSAADLAFQIDTLASPTGRIEAPPRTEPAGRPARAAVMAAMFAAGALAGWLGLARVLPRTAAPAAPVTRTSLLTYSGRDFSPAVSPDQQTIAFVSGRDGTDRIWLRQLATGEEAALTAGPDSVPRFSPDGATVLFVRYEASGSSLYRVPVVGGQPRRVLDRVTEGDFAPDGRVAFIRQRPNSEWLIGVAAADGGQMRESPNPVLTALQSPRWSADGRSIAVVQSGVQASINDRLLVYDAATLVGTPIEPIETGGHLSAPAWSASGDLLYAQSTDVTAYTPQSRVVVQRPSGGGRTIAWLPALVSGLDLLGDGGVILDLTTNRQNLREADWAASGLTPGRWLTRGTSSDRQPAYSPDGKWVVFSAARNGNLDLWITSPQTGETRRLTDDRAQDWDPAFTPDGKHLLWSSNRSGNFEIWIAEADGRNARQLTKDGIDAENPTATPDGEWVVYGAGSDPTQGLWKIRLDGSQATKIVTGLNAHPEVSPDGQHVLYHTVAIGSGQVHIVRTADGRPVIPPINVAPAGRLSAGLSSGRGRWRPDGRAIVYVGVEPTGMSCLYEQAFRLGEDTSATRRILQRSEPMLSVESFGISRDGKRVTISFIEDQFTLMRLDGLPGVSALRSRK